MLEVKNSQAFMQKLRKDKVRLENKVAETHRRIIAHIYRDLVVMSPQWSGNLASNWVIEYTGVTGGYKQSPKYKPAVRNELPPLEPEPYRMSSEPTVSLAISREMRKLAGIRYNTIVTIVNRTPYAKEVQATKGPHGRKIRPVNLGRYGKVAMLAYVDAKYNNLRTLKRLAT